MIDVSDLTRCRYDVGWVFCILRHTQLFADR